MAYVAAPIFRATAVVGESPELGVIRAMTVDGEKVPGGESGAMLAKDGTVILGGTAAGIPVYLAYASVAVIRIGSFVMAPTANLATSLGELTAQFSTVYAGAARLSGTTAVVMAAASTADIHLAADATLRVMNAAQSKAILSVNPVTETVTMPNAVLGAFDPSLYLSGAAALRIGGAMLVSVMNWGAQTVLGRFVNQNVSGSINAGLYILSNGFSSVTLAASGDAARTLILASGNTAVLTLEPDGRALFAGTISMVADAIGAARVIKATAPGAPVPAGARALYVDA
jgi:hypothetical protein